MVPSVIAGLKKQSRLALHRAMAVSAVYQDDSTPPTWITVRQHNRLARNGSMEGGYDTEIIEGIDRLVFNETDLAVNAVVVETGLPPETPVVLRSAGLVTIPEYKGAKYELEAEEPSDGPESIYWSVSRTRG